MQTLRLEVSIAVSAEAAHVETCSVGQKVLDGFIKKLICLSDRDRYRSATF